MTDPRATISSMVTVHPYFSNSVDKSFLNRRINNSTWTPFPSMVNQMIVTPICQKKKLWQHDMNNFPNIFSSKWRKKTCVFVALKRYKKSLSPPGRVQHDAEKERKWNLMNSENITLPKHTCTIPKMCLIMDCELSSLRSQGWAPSKVQLLFRCLQIIHQVNHTVVERPLCEDMGALASIEPHLLDFHGPTRIW
jgi:hypothetical protein